MELLGEISVHIFSRLNNEQLRALSIVSPTMRRIITSLPQLFWYNRTLVLLDRTYPLKIEGADWKQIYKNLTASGRQGFSRGISHLDTMKVLMSTSSKAINTEDISHIRNEDVLQYVLEQMMASKSLDEFQLGAVERAIRGTMQLSPPRAVAMARMSKRIDIDLESSPLEDALYYSQIGAYEELLQAGFESLEDEDAQKMAIKSNNVDTLRYVLKASTSYDLEELTSQALHYNSSNTLGYILGKRDLAPTELKDIFTNWNGRQKRPQPVQVLLDAGLKLDKDEWNRLARTAIKTDDWSMLEFVLQYYDPRSENNDLLMLAMKGHLRTLRVLLADQRIDPNINLTNILQKNTSILDELVKHPNIIMEDLPLPDRRKIYSVLMSRGMTEEYPISELVSPLTAYWSIAGYMIVKQPTARRLLSYIRDNLLGREEVRQALASVLDNRKEYSDEAAAIRALLLFLVYPNITIQESTQYLRDDGYSQELISQSNSLIKLVHRTHIS